MKKNTPRNKEHLLKRFENSFESMQDASVAFYGYGNTSKSILNYTTLKFKNMCFIEQGEHKAGSDYEGYLIVELKQVSNYADFVIVISDIGYFSIILHRIISCGLPIYSIDGYCGKLEKTHIFKRNMDKLFVDTISKKICQKIENHLSKINGYYSIGNLRQLGYTVFGPVVYVVLCYIFEEWKKGEYEELLFLARDGYLFLEDYKFFLEKMGYKGWPSAKYTLASTRVLYITGIENEDEFNSVKKYSFNGSIERYFETRFGFKIPDNEENKYKKVIIPNQLSELDVYFEKYGKDIHQSIKQEREEYLNYLKSLKIGENYAIFDNGFTGYSAFQFEKILKIPYKKTYFIYKDYDSTYCGEKVEAICQADNMGAKNTYMRQDFALLEAVFSAPVGSLIKMERGMPCYQKQDVDFNVCAEVNDGIKDFISDVVNEIEDTCSVAKLGEKIDELYGLLMHHTLWQDDFENKLQRGTSF